MTPITAGTRIGRYQVVSKLGAGGMGEVYLADDLQLGRRVALKVLPPDAAGNATAQKRLVREARAAAALDHPSICAVYEVGEAEGRPFIAMQYVQGETLDARLRRAPPPVGETLAMAIQMVDALAAAHARGILHRDIKPANIMISARGHATVMDFGLAALDVGGDAAEEAATASQLSTPGAVLGTAPYMSPEQVRGEPLDARTDLFSAGIVLYEMLCGQRPFQGKSAAVIAAAVLTHHPPPVGQLAPATPAELERIVTKAMRKDPEGRYQTAKDLLVDLRALRDDLDFKARLENSSTPAAAPTVANISPSSRRGRGPALAIAVCVVLVAVLIAAGWGARRVMRARGAAAQVPQVAALAAANRLFDAYDLATAIEPDLTDTAALASLWPAMADTLSVTTDPPGAAVYLTRYMPDAAAARTVRQRAGTTPIAGLRIARGEYVLAIEKDGYATIERTVSGVTMRAAALTITPPPIRIEQRLRPAAEMPSRMVAVPGGDYRLVAWSRPTDRRVTLSDYFIDTYEVSNADFKDFINAGGYLKREFWTHPFVKDGRPLSWEQAMALLVDRTGLPGPRDWSNQTPPEGRADHPVTSISWYEAEAYAAFRGKHLPTIFQWEKAARFGVLGLAGVTVMPWGPFYPGDALTDRANFGSGTAPVTSAAFGMSPFGAYNMAGNVAEWTRNDSSDGFLATGGSWGDPAYTFAKVGGRPGLFSSSTLGFRTVQEAAGAGDEGSERVELADAVPVYTPSTNAAFAEWAAVYRYDKTPLGARVEETADTAEWRRETITFNVANGARATAYLYVPNHVARPLQVLHYIPAGDVQSGFRSLRESMDDRMAPFVKAGRAVFGVALEGYRDRPRPAGVVLPDVTTVEYVELMVARITDLRRGLDYLETRSDIDLSRVGILAPSAGGQLALGLAAVESRYRAMVLVGAGLPAYFRAFAGAANPINFAPHILMPKLVVQGRYDEDSPLRTAAEPLFALLTEPKRIVVYDGGHVPTIEVLMGATSSWLDETMGRVAR